MDQFQKEQEENKERRKSLIHSEVNLALSANGSNPAIEDGRDGIIGEDIVIGNDISRVTKLDTTTKVSKETGEQQVVHHMKIDFREIESKYKIFQVRVSYHARIIN